MDKILELKHNKKSYYVYNILITYTDGTSENFEATILGTSLDNPNFMIFSGEDPNSADDKDLPELMVNVNIIKNIRIVGRKEVEYKNERR